MDSSYPSIKKQDGTFEPFRPEKLLQSLLRSGAAQDVAHSVVEHIGEEVSEGDSTSTIYRHAFSLLKRRSAQIPAARYSMKRAIRELGPSGFPFEDFVAEIFKAKGYQTQTGVEMKGACATHEVDLVASKDSYTILAEIKFHNNLGVTSDLKVVLYVDARFVDIGEKAGEPWLLTNTRFTHNALRYGECRGMRMVSWSHPSVGCLQDLIEESGVQPITALPSLSGQEKRLLLDKGVVLCKHINRDPHMLDGLIEETKARAILEESRALCRNSRAV